MIRPLLGGNFQEVENRLWPTVLQVQSSAFSVHGRIAVKIRMSSSDSGLEKWP